MDVAKKNFLQLKEAFTQAEKHDVKPRDSAIAMKAYMRDQFEFYGITSKPRRELQKPILANYKQDKNIDFSFVKLLWQADERECQYCALDYLYSKRNFLQASDLDTIKDLITTKSWWDSIDGLAPYCVGSIAKNDPNVVNIMLNDWAVADNFWLRRSAILFQLTYKKETDTAVLEAIIAKNKDEKEFFIRKAIGWVLREYSKTDPAWVRECLKRHQFQPLSVREASKYI